MPKRPIRGRLIFMSGAVIVLASTHARPSIIDTMRGHIGLTAPAAQRIGSSLKGRMPFGNESHSEAEAHALSALAGKVVKIVGAANIEWMAAHETHIECGELVFVKALDRISEAVESMTRAEYGEIATYGRPFATKLTAESGQDTPDLIVGIAGFNDILPRSDPDKLARFQRSMIYSGGEETVKDLAILTLGCLAFDLVRQAAYRSMCAHMATG